MNEIVYSHYINELALINLPTTSQDYKRFRHQISPLLTQLENVESNDKCETSLNHIREALERLKLFVNIAITKRYKTNKLTAKKLIACLSSEKSLIDLPLEILQKIFTFFKLSEMATISLVSKRWYLATQYSKKKDYLDGTYHLSASNGRLVSYKKINNAINKKHLSLPNWLNEFDPISKLFEKIKTLEDFEKINVIASLALERKEEEQAILKKSKSLNELYGESSELALEIFKHKECSELYKLCLLSVASSFKPLETLFGALKKELEGEGTKGERFNLSLSQKFEAGEEVYLIIRDPSAYKKRKLVKGHIFDLADPEKNLWEVRVGPENQTQMLLLEACCLGKISTPSII